MKYTIIPYIALGFILSLVIGIEYNVTGEELLPEYFASPFVFMRKSLGASMEFYFSISGILLNVLVWSLGLYFIDNRINKFIANSESEIRIGYRIVIYFLIAYSTFHVAFIPIMTGRGFDPDRNYWFWNLDEEVEKWGGECEAKIIFYKF